MELVYVVAFALCLLVAGLQPIPALVVHAVLPLLSCAALLLLRSDGGFASVQDALPCETRAPARLPLRLFAGIGLFGAINLLTNSLSEAKSSATAELNTLLAGLVVSAVIALFAWRRGEKFDSCCCTACSHRSLS